MSSEKGPLVPEPGAEAAEAFDETIVVVQPAADDTVVVAQPVAVEDATIVVAHPVGVEQPVVDDATVVVALPVPVELPSVEDATVVVAQPTVEDATVVRPRRARRAESESEPAPPRLRADLKRPTPQPDPEATMISVRTSSRDPAPPVEEPDAELSERALAKLLFKPPLDPRRRVKESPFPQLEHTLPKRGVSKDMPVVYGVHSEELAAQPDGKLDLEQRIGAPPTTLAPPPVVREGLPSAAQLNRKFRLLALLGGAGVVVVVAAGLWGIAALAF